MRRGGKPAFLHGGSSARCICVPPALSGGHCGAGLYSGPEPCSLRDPGAGVQLQQPAGLHCAACAQGLCGQNLQNINRYFASGWNRDGLALRAAGDLLQFAPGPAPRHLLIVLTDASPNDSRRIPPSPENRWAAVTRTPPVWPTLPRRCVRCSAWASGCLPCSWARTALPVPLHRSTAKYGTHPRHGPAGSCCRAADPERDPGTGRLK